MSYSLDESTEIISSSELLSTSPFEILSPDTSQELPRPKMIKNLKEFWAIGRPKSFSSIADFSPSNFSLRSKASTASSTYESLKNAVADVDLNGQVFLDDISTRSDEGTTPTEHCSLGDSTKTFQCSTTTNGVAGIMQENTNLNKNGVSGGRSRLSSSCENNELSSSHLSKSAPAGGSYSDNVRKSFASSSPTTSTENNVMTSSTELKNLNMYHHNNSNNINSGNGKLDVEGVSQGGESEHDSGHCLSESFENSVEPEFQTGSTRQPPKMPSPETLGGGNPFLMFLCLTLLLQHRDHIMKNRMDYNETAMYFDKMIRKHNVIRVLGHARQMYSNYLKQNVSHA